MADLVVTAANVVAAANAIVNRSRNAGEVVAAGKTVHLSLTTKKWMLADSNSATLEARTADGVALNGAALNQPLAVATGGDVVMGATLTPGAPYYLSETPGGIQPATDLGSGENVCQIGLAKDASTLTIDIQAPGVTL